MKTRPRASRRNANIKNTPNTPTPTTPHEDWLHKRTIDRQQRETELGLCETELGPQIQQEEGQLDTSITLVTNKDDESAPSMQGSPSSQFPDNLANISVGSNSWTTSQTLKKSNKRLDVRIDATKSYFESKFSRNRNKYAQKLADLDKFKIHVENMNWHMENFLQITLSKKYKKKSKKNLLMCPRI